MASCSECLVLSSRKRTSGSVDHKSLSLMEKPTFPYVYRMLWHSKWEVLFESSCAVNLDLCELQLNKCIGLVNVLVIILDIVQSNVSLMWGFYSRPKRFSQMRIGCIFIFKYSLVVGACVRNVLGRIVFAQQHFCISFCLLLLFGKNIFAIFMSTSDNNFSALRRRLKGC